MPVRESEGSPMNDKKTKISLSIIVIGIIIVAMAVSGIIYEQVTLGSERQKTTEAITLLEEILPNRTVGIMENRSNNTMPSVEIYSRNYIGLLEVPKRNAKVPICAEWDKQKVAFVPCLLKGSVYDGSIIIGGADCEGQFDFLDEIEIDEQVLFTDVTGQEFSYKVVSVKHSNTAETEILESEKSDLTLFVRASWTFEYIIVRCVV